VPLGSECGVFYDGFLDQVRASFVPAAWKIAW
jgi:hypothetical protein